jgi:ankyrin repeat protein
LYIAAAHGRVEAIRVLQELGADVNQPNKHGFTPLHIAAENGHVGAISVLIEKLGIKVNQASNSGRSPIFCAAREGHLEVVKALIEFGADAQEIFISTTESLIEFSTRRGASVKDEMDKKIKDYMGREDSNKSHVELSPTDIAQIMGHSSVVDELRRHEIRAQMTSTRPSPLFFKKEPGADESSAALLPICR